MLPHRIFLFGCSELVLGGRQAAGWEVARNIGGCKGCECGFREVEEGGARLTRLALFQQALFEQIHFPSIRFGGLGPGLGPQVALFQQVHFVVLSLTGVGGWVVQGRWVGIVGGW